jgi:hypothetical protein
MRQYHCETVTLLYSGSNAVVCVYFVRLQFEGVTITIEFMISWDNNVRVGHDLFHQIPFRFHFVRFNYCCYDHGLLQLKGSLSSEVLQICTLGTYLYTHMYLV